MQTRTNSVDIEKNCNMSICMQKICFETAEHEASRVSMKCDIDPLPHWGPVAEEVPLRYDTVETAVKWRAQTTFRSNASRKKKTIKKTLRGRS